MGKYYSLKVTGDNSGVLSVTLPDVLSCVADSNHLEWRILWIWAIGCLKDFENMLDFEDKVTIRKKGFSSVGTN